MRIVCFLGVLLYALVSAGAASDQPRSAVTDQTSGNPASAQSISIDRSATQLFGSPGATFGEEYGRNLFDYHRKPGHFYLDEPEDTVTCLKMRSYLVARENKDSDETHMVGYTTCTPSSKFDLRLSTDPAIVPER